MAATRLQRLAGHLVSALIVGALVVTLVGFAGRWHWYADLFNHLRPQYAIALALAFVGCVWLRRWWCAAVSAFGLALNALVLVPHGLPASSPHVSHEGFPVLHIATINLLVSNPNHDSVTKQLRDRRPDFVVFQEAGEPWVSTLESLKDIYPHQRIEFHRRSYFGLAILSRFPWQSADLVKLGDRSDSLGLAMQFQWHGRAVSVMNIHAYHPTSAEKVQYCKLMHDALILWSSERRRVGDAVIIAGDFNCTPWSVLFSDFMQRSRLLDSSQGSIFEATRNVWYPNRLLIDHAFVSEDWHVLKREVGPDIGSDHRPVFVDLAVIQKPAVTSFSAAPGSRRR